MEIHLTSERATSEEQSSVDDILGPAEKPAVTASDNGVSFSKADSSNRRDLLLPVLHAIQSRIGWISPGALNYVATRLDVAPA